VILAFHTCFNETAFVHSDIVSKQIFDVFFNFSRFY